MLAKTWYQLQRKPTKALYPPELNLQMVRARESLSLR